MATFTSAFSTFKERLRAACRQLVLFILLGTLGALPFVIRQIRRDQRGTVAIEALAKSRNFDWAAARKAGYTDSEIYGYLLLSARPSAPNSPVGPWVKYQAQRAATPPPVTPGATAGTAKPSIDYDALAKQAGSIPAPVDYDALARKYGGTPARSLPPIPPGYKLEGGYGGVPATGESSYIFRPSLSMQAVMIDAITKSVVVGLTVGPPAWLLFLLALFLVGPNNVQALRCWFRHGVVRRSAIKDQVKLK